MDARLVRRVIKAHRHLPGLGLQVPHARCYALAKGALLGIVDARELGVSAGDLPDDVILLPRPDPEDAAAEALPDLLTHLWRYAFHAAVHVAIDRLVASGALTLARIRERIHRIGQTEFDEIRLVLKQDGILLPPHDDAETYAEFAALYLELSRFAPALVHEMFPALADRDAVERAIGEDVDVGRLLEATRPEGAAPRAEDVDAPSAERLEAERDALEADREEADLSRIPLDDAGLVRDLANIARSRGNRARSALLRLRVGDTAEARADLTAIVSSLDRALVPTSAGGEPRESVDAEAWRVALLGLARHAVSREEVFRRVSARLLYDVQSAGIAGERAIGEVDLIDWAISLGRRPIARLLPATRGVRVARELAHAAAKVPRVDLPEAARAELAALVADARRRADDSIRRELRSPVEDALRGVGFKPGNAPERVALSKIIEELLDQATAHGHMSLGQLRDAISRNQLKMPDLAGAGALVLGDPLLSADRRLAAVLDGVHRRGEIYVRLLQKLSSLLFGTRPGRFFTLYVLLPVGGAYMLPFATQLVITELAHLTHVWSHHQHLHLVPQPQHLREATPPEIALIATMGLLIFGLLHSAAVRAAAIAVARALGFVIGGIFVDGPRWILARPFVRRALRSPLVLGLTRFVVRPGAFAATALYATPLHDEPEIVALPGAGAAFVVAAFALNSRPGVLAVEIAEDAVARMLRQVQRHLLPGLFRLIVSAFRRLTDALDRGIYRVDEWLRFREGQSAVALAGKAVLGLAWFAIAYVLRIYVNLLLEPTFNPIKHFPTVTVAAKIMLPIDHDLAKALVAALTPVAGGSLARILAGLTVVSLPGFFGFLVWELKENYKLYAATRSSTLGAVIIGHHGETMGALMKPGFHSGTLPKLWHKLRRAARQGDASVEKHREAMREIEETVERFVDRELCALLAESDRFSGGVHVARVALASNRVRVELARTDVGHHADGAGACAIAFEEQSGWLVACVAEPGWSAALAGEERVLFENALAGLYHRAGVDFVREQIAAALPAESTYDIADEGLVVWPPGFATEVVYGLDAKPKLEPRGAGPDKAPSIDRADIAFREQSIAWTAWVEAWTGAPKRLVKGASLLPPPRPSPA